MKIIHDNCPEIQLAATGSSSFELTDKIKESLTGRKWTFKLFPLSLEELTAQTNKVELIRSLETRMIFGSYPEVDYIEEFDGKIHAYEFKWQDTGKARAASAFLTAYPEAEIKVTQSPSHPFTSSSSSLP
ncbi:MAG: AAA family ATPase [Bacteroidales bacterium]|nr:AAA family ATPase [Bacteroidales bacterium]